MTPPMTLSLKTVMLLALIAAPAAAELNTQEVDAGREKWERVPQIIAALQIAPGSRVADVGCGDGFYTERIARAIGPGGRVTAVDISEKALGALRQRRDRAKLTNVDVVLGQVADPLLEPGAYDAVLIYNAYHDMTEHRSMLQHILLALRPGGRLVMLERSRDKHRLLPRADQVSTHEIALEIAMSELTEAGFQVRQKDESFNRFDDLANPGGFWMLVAIRPVHEDSPKQP